ncbi:unnamed protein product [Rotaria magnacalcarata]|uniref:Uncharacterized protein n=1 Tax=Rotaria magnacalcarata TaxID=392030 RepID=A0A816VYF4_9BILA|nr:unnamed protein product [Rotaria magnacalcarata]CAF3759822.1 unnamed protein product [Rotaria magnacalcarata]
MDRLQMNINARNISDALVATVSKYRQWNNRVSLAYRLSILTMIFWSLLVDRRLILFSIKKGICAPLIGFYADYDDYFEVIFTGICPPIVMSILAYLLIRSVRNLIQRHIVPKNIYGPSNLYIDHFSNQWILN